MPGFREELGNKLRAVIVGFCQTSREWTNYADPDAEIWGLNRGALFMPKAHRWFDLHSPTIRTWQQRRPGDHQEWLKKFPGPVFLHAAEEELPNSVTYPFDEVWEPIAPLCERLHEDGTRTPAEPYLTSSIADEIALAVLEGFPEIWVLGVDLNTESEYFKQKPGVEFWLGVAIGRGQKVVLPDNCPLLEGRPYGRAYLEGEGESLSYEQLEQRLQAVTRQRDQLTIQQQELIGAKRENEFLCEQIVPGIDHTAFSQRLHDMEHAEEEYEQHDAMETGAYEQTLRMVLAKRKAKLAEAKSQLAQEVGARKEITLYLQHMPGGIWQERLEDRRKKMDDIIGTLSAGVHQLHGAIKELVYWIHQTPDGERGEVLPPFEDDRPEQYADGDDTAFGLLSEPERELAGVA